MIVLASGSPRRKELLGILEPAFTVITSDVDETPTKTKADEIVEELSLRKAEDVLDKIKREKLIEESEPTLIIAADTLVFKGDTKMGKPLDERDAVRMLKELQNDVHDVYTGVTLIYVKDGETKFDTFNEKTSVEFAELTDKEISEYVASKEPMDKAGAYAIQGLSCKFIKSINGEYNNVVGLPVARLYQELKRIGFY